MHAGASGEYATALSTRLPDGGDELAVVAADDQPVLTADADLDALGAAAVSGTRSTASATTSSTATGSGSAAASAPCSRDRSISSCTSAVSRSASCCIRAAKRRDGVRVVGGVRDRLGEQRAARRSGS